MQHFRSIIGDMALCVIIISNHVRDCEVRVSLLTTMSEESIGRTTRSCTAKSRTIFVLIVNHESDWNNVYASMRRPVSIPQKSQAVVTSNNAPTFQPTFAAMASQSHLLPQVKCSHQLNPSSGLCDLARGVTSPGITLLVTHIWTVRDQPVVTPITIHARSGRRAPRNHNVRYVAGQQRH